MIPMPLIEKPLANGQLIDLMPEEPLKVEIFLYVLKPFNSAMPQAVDLLKMAANDYLDLSK